MRNPFKQESRNCAQHKHRKKDAICLRLVCFSLLALFVYRFVSSSSSITTRKQVPSNSIDKMQDGGSSSTTTSSDFFKQVITRNDLSVNFNERNGSLEDKYKLTPVKCAGAVVASTDTTILMHDTGMISWICGERKSSDELKVTKVMLTLFQKYDKGGLMLDIGANAGYYSLLAAKMGHNSVQFDLQPECQNILRNSVLANKFQNQIITIAAGVSDSDGTVEVPVIGCNGQFPQILPKKGTPTTSAQLHPLDHFISYEGNIMLMKVDTEGNEKRVLSGAIRFFKEKIVNNAIVEVTPCCDFWKKAGIEASEVRKTLGDIVSYGYIMVSLFDYKIFRTAEEVEKYLEEAPFRQSDMWLTLEKDIHNMTTSVLLPSKPNTEWYV
mmetsp:Transcript_4631/g.7010  ORF Transcript_4631/g.7010 Transcript_4631/m.7010 type:complete len:382 (-) Transcript_4631:151-1296(-)